MSNKPESETALISQVMQDLRRQLPEGWNLRFQREPSGGARRPDAVLELRAGKERARISVEAKLRLDPGQLRRLLSTALLKPGRTLLVTGYLSRAAQSLLAERGVNYADATGNVRLALQSPPFFLRLEGASKEPWREPRPLRSLRGPVAGRVIRALCDLRPPFRVRELAQTLRTSAAMVSRVVDILDREGLVEREPRGPITAVDWEKLLRRWTEDYSFARSNRVRQAVALKGLPGFVDRLRKAKTTYAVTGSLAAQAIRSVAPPRLAMIYAMDMVQLSSELDLERTDTGANVLVAEPFDPVVFERTSRRDGVVYAALSQVAADLLTGPGRSPQEGEALIEWMKIHEPAWRS
jgi:hypothetical protein